MNERSTEWLEKEEVKRVLEKTDLRTRQGLRDRCVLQVLAETGIRKGELIALKIGSLATHNEAPILKVQTLKKRSHEPIFRNLPITNALDTVLRRYIKWERGDKINPDDALFRTLGSRGNCAVAPLTARAVDLIVARYLKKAGIGKRITSHSLRHTNATRLLESGADVETVRQLLGHSSLSSTQRYVHSTDDRKREAIEKLGFSDGL